MNATHSNIAGWLAVFDRHETSAEDLASIKPFEPFPARFRTKEEAMARKESWEKRDRKADWSIFEGAIPPTSPEWPDARYEVRIISAEWLEGPDSFLDLAQI